MYYTDHKFKKGFLLGSLLTSASLIAFAMTKKGRKLTDELHHELGPLTDKLKEQLDEIKDLNKEKFDELVETLVEALAKKKELAYRSKKALLHSLQAKWYEMREWHERNR